MNRRLLVLSIFMCPVLAACGIAPSSFDAAPEHGADLSGGWRLNAALSDDPERMLEERLAEENERDEQWRRRMERARPPEAPPAIDVHAAPNRRGRRPWQIRREENFRQMLGVTKMLTIRQEGSRIEIDSALESRRLVAGAQTQVSLPEGQLADSSVGWDGDVLVIERVVRRGPRVIEQFRLLKNTDQLEYTMAWSGDTELKGIKTRRVFDRVRTPAGAAEAGMGPVR